MDQVLLLLRMANRRHRDAAAVAATIDQICDLLRAERYMAPTLVLSAVVGLGLGAMPPTDAKAVEVLGGHVIRLAGEANYPWDECAEALVELARSAPQLPSLVDRINVRLAFGRTFDELAEKSQGRFTSAQASACKAKVQQLPQLDLPPPELLDFQTTPCAIMASATFTKPPTLAPST